MEKMALSKFQRKHKTLPIIIAVKAIPQLVFPILKDLPSVDDRYELHKRISFVNKRLNKVMDQLMIMIGSTKKLRNIRHDIHLRTALRKKKLIQKFCKNCTGTKAS